MKDYATTVLIHIYILAMSYSAIDLTVTDPSFLLDSSWKVHDNLCGSDNFPIILESLNSTEGDKSTRYKFDKADWNLYEHMCREKRQTEKYEMPPI